MPCHGTRFSEDKSAICVDVPIDGLDVNDDQQLTTRLLDLVRYAILARSIFGELYTTIWVAETDDDRSTHRIVGQLKGSDLDDWISELAGLVDLLNDSEWSIEGKALGVEVDYERLREMEHASPDMPFPRRAKDET